MSVAAARRRLITISTFNTNLRDYEKVNVWVPLPRVKHLIARQDYRLTNTSRPFHLYVAFCGSIACAAEVE